MICYETVANVREYKLHPFFVLFCVLYCLLFPSPIWHSSCLTDIGTHKPWLLALFAICAYLMYYISSDINNDEYCVYDLMYLCIYYMAIKFFRCHCHCQESIEKLDISFTPGEQKVKFSQNLVYFLDVKDTKIPGSHNLWLMLTGTPFYNKGMLNNGIAFQETPQRRDLMSRHALGDASVLLTKRSYVYILVMYHEVYRQRGWTWEFFISSSWTIVDISLVRFSGICLREI